MQKELMVVTKSVLGGTNDKSVGTALVTQSNTEIKRVGLAPVEQRLLIGKVRFDQLYTPLDLTINGSIAFTSKIVEGVGLFWDDIDAITLKWVPSDDVLMTSVTVANGYEIPLLMKKVAK